MQKSPVRKPVLATVAGLAVAGTVVVGLQSAYAGADVDLARGKAATGSPSCRAAEGPASAVNGSVGGGMADKWCSVGASSFLQVDLGAAADIGRIVIRHAGAGGEPKAWNTRDFTVAASTDGKKWSTVVTHVGNTGDVTDDKITPVKARYLKLAISKPTDNPVFAAARIYEFEAYAATTPSVTQQAFEHINAYRAAHGLAAFKLDAKLNDVAQAHSDKMAAGCGLSHNCPGEPGLSDRFASFGVTSGNVAENVFSGTADDTTASITASTTALTDQMLTGKPGQGSFDLLVSTSYTSFGLAVTRSSDGKLWMTQTFSA